MNGKITLAIEVFEHACDDAIQEIGSANAYNILVQRRERWEIIQKLAASQKHQGEKLFTRGVSEEELAARRELFRQEFEKATAPPDAEWSPAPLDI
jgi:hypothetical protein